MSQGSRRLLAVHIPGRKKSEKGENKAFSFFLRKFHKVPYKTLSAFHWPECGYLVYLALREGEKWLLDRRMGALNKIKVLPLRRKGKMNVGVSNTFVDTW